MTDLEHPVNARSRHEAHSIVDNYMILVRDAEGANLRGKLSSGRHHVREWVLHVLDRFNVKVARLS